MYRSAQRAPSRTTRSVSAYFVSHSRRASQAAFGTACGLSLRSCWSASASTVGIWPRVRTRATSTLLAWVNNWLRHGVVTPEQVRETFARMAKVVDAQNAGDAAYRSLAEHPQGAAMQAALDLVFKGEAQPSGYTEPLLHAWRLKVKTAP